MLPFYYCVPKEPILQWNLGTEIHLSEIIPFLKIAYSLKVVKRLCASDVSILAPLFYQPERLDAGTYILIVFTCLKSDVVLQSICLSQFESCGEIWKNK